MTNMVARVWTKPQTQQAIRALRAAGAPVTKLSAGYEIKDKDGNIVFKAMNGTNGYLIMHHKDLFEPVTSPATSGV